MEDDIAAATLMDTPSARHWRDSLKGVIRPDWAAEIDDFEAEIRLKKQGKIEDKVFAETRLRRGVYGQRYDNGKRHDGKTERKIAFPSAGITKGPGTEWDAPGMLRIKIPYGGLTAGQLDTLAEVAEEYSDGILHVTTRQDFQIHFVHIEDTPAIFRRLAAAGITTREACGNTVRNVTGCPVSGVCADEAFDVTPYADAAFKFLLGHPDAQDFGRKFKVSFSGCADKPCALARMHDVGFIAVKKSEGGRAKRGFEMLIGGGLGAVPYQAQIFSDFVPEEEILPLTQAICRVFTVHGEKKNRNKARLKFLLADWGLKRFKEEVLRERASLPHDPRWTAYLNELPKEAGVAGGGSGKGVEAVPADAEFAAWRATNAMAERQDGFFTAMVNLPLGDLTSNQARAFSDIVRKYSPDGLRTSVEQNVIIRSVRASDLAALHSDLKAIGLARVGAGMIADITACPGTDTCKLGTSSSRGLAAALEERIAAKFSAMDLAAKKLRIKISGCFNSCAQHHIADIGFYGVGRKVGNYMVPHFQLVLGGSSSGNASSYGLAVMAIPSKAVPEAVDRLVETYLKERSDDEKFPSFVERKGKGVLKALLSDLTAVPDHAVDPSFYTDFSDVREYSKSDIGVGECAGEVVSPADFGLKAAEREIFAAQVALDAGDPAGAVAKALAAMTAAAEGLVKTKNPFVTGADQVEIEFKKLYCDTKVFHDPFAGDRFANFFFKARAERSSPKVDQARQRVEEAQLFVDAAYACLGRIA